RCRSPAPAHRPNAPIRELRRIKLVGQLDSCRFVAGDFAPHARGAKRVTNTMNTRMANVFTALCVGFLGIVIMLTWWQIVVAGDLRQKDENNQTAYYEQRIQRGFITTRTGTKVATRVASNGPNGDRIW